MSTPYYELTQRVIAEVEAGTSELPQTRDAMEQMTAHVGHPDPGAVLEILGLVQPEHASADDTLTLGEVYDVVETLTERWRRADEDDANIVIGDVLHIIEE